MADVVQHRLERMVDELDDLERKGLFTRREIAEIVKKRRQFEYRLKRPSPLKQDFISYIDYESHLDSLRKLRKKSILSASDPDSDNNKWKNSISDSACTRRILGIYRLAVTRYKGDVDLWFRYLEFCRNRGHGRMKQVLAQVLRFHPKVPGLWIYAAAWEFDHNLNVAAARALMQSGLRACPASEDLWVEYLRMELTYLNKLKARKAVLGEDEGTLARDSRADENAKWKDENKDSFMYLDKDKANENGLNGKEGNPENKIDAFQEQGLIIFRTIYSGAAESIPSSLSLRKRLWEILEESELGFSEELREEIMESIQKDFSRDEDYWDWYARLKFLGHEKGSLGDIGPCHLNEAIKVYDEALNILPSAKMFSLCARFWLDLISPEQGGPQSSSGSSGNTAAHSTEITSHLLKVYEKAESSGCITKDLAHQYISFYLKLGRMDEARNLAKKLCSGELSGVANLWILRVSIEMKMATTKSDSMTKKDFQSLFELLNQALSKVSSSESESLWFMAMKLFSNNKEHFDKLVQNFMFFMAKGNSTESNSSIAFAIVNWVLQRNGIRHAREMYNRILALPRPSLETYKKCIELEINLAMAGDADGLANARKLYESAVSIYRQNVGLWKDYYSLELKVGSSDTSNAIYWRARKTVGERIGMVEP